MTSHNQKHLMNSDINSPEKFQRHHHLDWLRIVAIVILLFYHVGMLFNTWQWHVKNSHTDSSFDYWMIWLHAWRMPLLLFISGAGAFFSMSKRSAGSFATERTVRLFIPLVFGIFVVVPPQIYFEYNEKYANYWDFYQTVFEFKRYPPGSFSWHHLWFVAYLFLYSLICIALIKFLHSDKAESFKKRLVRVASRPVAMLIIPAFFIFLTQLILRPYFDEETHALLDDWAYFAFYFCFFLFGILCYSAKELLISVKMNRWIFLVAAAIVLIPYYVSFLALYDLYQLPWGKETSEMIFGISGIFCSWFTVLTIVAFGARYLDHSNSSMPLLTEGLYPFYILHQTVIVAIGFYVCQLDWSIGLKFWIVTILTLIICVSFYVIIIKPISFVRVFFGLKKNR